MATKKETTATKKETQATSKVEIVKIKQFEDKVATIRIVGDSPLICHNWSLKNKLQLPAGKQALEEMGKKKSITDKDDHAGPMECFIESLYWICGKPTEYTQEAFDDAIANGARFGFRVESFKSAALDAAYSKKWIPNKKSVQGLFFIKPDAIDEDGFNLVEIKGDKPTMREDIVILSGMSRKPDIRWRGEFRNWYCDLNITYDADGVYSISDIVNMFNAGGRYSGIGEYRPEKSGQFGMFHVEIDGKGKK
jgi:hypothetical protein